jgi:hypothetical protein
VTPEIKLRTLAAGNATLQSFFGAAPFRWFDVQVPQGQFAVGTCARLQRVSTARMYVHQSFAPSGLQPASGPLLNLSMPRFQLDIIDADTETCRQAAIAVTNWLGGISLAEDNWLASPVTTPPQFPCFVLNQRHGLYADTQPPLPVVTVDFRAYNYEEQ